MAFTNTHDINIVLLPWLLGDEYDYSPNEKEISTTTLMKPIRQTVLLNRLKESSIDVSELIASRLGTAIHDSVEKSWTGDRYRILTNLYPENVVDRLVVNPTEPVKKDIPIYIENRAYKKIMGWNISGKYDFIFNGKLVDLKTTSTWNYIYGSKDKDYQLQMSIYRWLNPDLVTEDEADICMIFTDWQKQKALTQSDYPKLRVLTKKIRLLSLVQTELWIRERIKLLEANMDLAEPVKCTDEELWLPEPVYSYYADPTKLTRATKNFDSLVEANAYLATKGKGVVIPKPRLPRRCGYCPVYDICTQRRKYFED